ncbi:uncharacterized protein [Typha latifolia]|uniref:uncharacterized protein n=1 Tax=Typha latifolia TaxID=4733 RepID=UPI003C2C940B
MTPLCLSSTSYSSFTSKFLNLTLIPPLPRRLHFKPHLTPQTLSFSSLSLRLSSPSGAGGRAFLSAASAIPIEDLVERDWSFLDSDPSSSGDDRAKKALRIIAAAEISASSKVLTVMPTVGFVDTLVESSPCDLLVAVHESLFVLAMIKEGHDRVRCWQGDVTVVPEKFTPFDVVFVCYFPGMGVSITQLLSSLAPRCSPGARVVICFDQGRQIVEQNHRQQYPDMVTTDLPDKAVLEKAAADNLYEITEFIDEPTIYLTVLRFCK